MKIKLLFFLFLVLSFILSSCGKIKAKGDMVSRDVPVEDFNNVNLEGKFRVYYVRGVKNFVNVETYDNLANNLKIKVSDKTLNISERRPVGGVDFYNITIYSKFGIGELSISDSVEFNVSSEIKTDNFKLNLKNNGKFIGSIKSRRAEVSMQDHSLANFRGFTTDAVMKLKDTSSIIAPYWFIDNLNLSDENGSYAEVNVKDTLKGNVKNSAKLLYYNDPIRAFKIEKTTSVNNKKLQ